MGIGIKLQELMKERDTNANELSSKTGIPVQTIYSLIKRDASKLEIDSLIKISHALGVNAEYFCSDELKDQPQTIAAHFDGDEYTEEEINKINEFAKFVKSQRK